MPIYEYACEDCGTTFEKLVRGSSPAVSCPHCGQAHLTPQYSTFAAGTSGSGSDSAAQASCGSGACGSGACGSGMCGMNYN